MKVGRDEKQCVGGSGGASDRDDGCGGGGGDKRCVILKQAKEVSLNCCLSTDEVPRRESRGKSLQSKAEERSGIKDVEESGEWEPSRIFTVSLS